MPEIFRSSRVKLRRAAKFIAEVHAGLEAYNANAPISARLYYEGSEAKLEISWKELDPDVLAALGDAIHNMRAALDLMASELARINGKSDRGVYFPFSSSKAELAPQISRKHFDRAGDDAIALLLQFAPYKGGNLRLRAIHDLDIQDKHTAILVTQHKTEGLTLQYRLDVGPEPPVQITAGVVSHNFLTDPLTGLPIIQTLKELVELVDGILEAFTALVAQRNAGRSG